MEKNQKRILITIGIAVIVLIGFFFLTKAITKYTGFSVSSKEENSFKSCLREKDVTLYINSLNSSDTLRNCNLFDYLDDIKIINCIGNKTPCIEKGITSFSWVIEGKKIDGDISILELSQLSGCNLIK